MKIHTKTRVRAFNGLIDKCKKGIEVLTIEEEKKKTKGQFNDFFICHIKRQKLEETVKKIEQKKLALIRENRFFNKFVPLGYVQNNM